MFSTHITCQVTQITLTQNNPPHSSQSGVAEKTASSEPIWLTAKHSYPVLHKRGNQLILDCTLSEGGGGPTEQSDCTLRKAPATAHSLLPSPPPSPSSQSMAATAHLCRACRNGTRQSQGCLMVSNTTILM